METPTRKGGTLPLHGAHTAFSCYPALRLYRLSKSPRGIDVVSLTLGNSGLPLADCLPRYAELFRERFLRKPRPLPAVQNFSRQCHKGMSSLHLWRQYNIKRGCGATVPAWNFRNRKLQSVSKQKITEKVHRKNTNVLHKKTCERVGKEVQ